MQTNSSESNTSDIDKLFEHLSDKGHSPDSSIVRTFFDSFIRRPQSDQHTIADFLVNIPSKFSYAIISSPKLNNFFFRSEQFENYDELWPDIQKHFKTDTLVDTPSKSLSSNSVPAPLTSVLTNAISKISNRSQLSLNEATVFDVEKNREISPPLYTLFPQEHPSEKSIVSADSLTAEQQSALDTYCNTKIPYNERFFTHLNKILARESFQNVAEHLKSITPFPPTTLSKLKFLDENASLKTRSGLDLERFSGLVEESNLDNKEKRKATRAFENLDLADQSSYITNLLQMPPQYRDNLLRYSTLTKDFNLEKEVPHFLCSESIALETGDSQPYNDYLHARLAQGLAKKNKKNETLNFNRLLTQIREFSPSEAKKKGIIFGLPSYDKATDSDSEYESLVTTVDGKTQRKEERFVDRLIISAQGKHPFVGKFIAPDGKTTFSAKAEMLQNFNDTICPCEIKRLSHGYVSLRCVSQGEESQLLVYGLQEQAILEIEKGILQAGEMGKPLSALPTYRLDYRRGNEKNSHSLPLAPELLFRKHDPSQVRYFDEHHDGNTLQDLQYARFPIQDKMKLHAIHFFSSLHDQHFTEGLITRELTKDYNPALTKSSSPKFTGRVMCALQSEDTRIALACVQYSDKSMGIVAGRVGHEFSEQDRIEITAGAREQGAAKRSLLFFPKEQADNQGNCVKSAGPPHIILHSEGNPSGKSVQPEDFVQINLSEGKVFVDFGQSDVPLDYVGDNPSSGIRKYDAENYHAKGSSIEVFHNTGKIQSCIHDQLTGWTFLGLRPSPPRPQLAKTIKDFQGDPNYALKYPTQKIAIAHLPPEMLSLLRSEASTPSSKKGDLTIDFEGSVLGIKENKKTRTRIGIAGQEVRVEPKDFKAKLSPNGASPVREEPKNNFTEKGDLLGKELTPETHAEFYQKLSNTKDSHLQNFNYQDRVELYRNGPEFTLKQQYQTLILNDPRSSAYNLCSNLWNNRPLHNQSSRSSSASSNTSPARC